MKSSFERSRKGMILAVSFWLAAKELWRERWGLVWGGVGFWVLVLVVKWIGG